MKYLSFNFIKGLKIIGGIRKAKQFHVLGGGVILAQNDLGGRRISQQICWEEGDDIFMVNIQNLLPGSKSWMVWVLHFYFTSVNWYKL